VWHADQPFPRSGGTLATAGNLVFHGRADGHFVAYRATDGKTLWEFDTGVGIMAGPMTYAVNGTQYVAVMAGWGGPTTLGNRPIGKGKIGGQAGGFFGRRNRDASAKQRNRVARSHANLQARHLPQ
jgi:hypothetical protein